MPKKGRTAITEKCFTKNVLEFATNFTMIKSLAALEDGWERFEQNDLREGTYPKGSVWRPVGKVMIAKTMRLLMMTLMTLILLVMRYHIITPTMVRSWPGTAR